MTPADSNFQGPDSEDTPTEYGGQAHIEPSEAQRFRSAMAAERDGRSQPQA
ncbi:hypothetical protein FRIGORI9N_420133 [Frigoribacterium sp. 9N]|jgi:hypothetical protein|nr:hypothetical protein FRIGORI9N_420133 [Frigoribacterium sp. 9N]